MTAVRNAFIDEMRIADLGTLAMLVFMSMSV
jgi:hypothetical protein